MLRSRGRRYIWICMALALLTVGPAPASAAPNAPSGDAEWQAFLDRSTKPAFNPNGRQRAVIRHFLRDRRDGVFLDVGAAHYREGSMTFFLENRLGWSGIAVDALESWAPDYAKHRPRTRFFTFIVTDHSGAEEPFYRLSGDIGSTANKARAEMIDEKFKKISVTEILVPTTTLDTLLGREGVRKIDFLSMDIEGNEPAALAGFDIERFRPQLVGIEVFRENQERISQYFESHGYQRLDEYLEYDDRNWYYTCKIAKDCAPETEAQNSQPTEGAGQR
jgi:FkbM family methyltransferase